MIEPLDDPAPAEWGDVANRLLRNDRTALAQVVRLITGHLVALRAYDLGDSKYDLIQDVLAALVRSLQRSDLRDSRAFVNYVGIVVRNKFFDLRRRTASDRELSRAMFTETHDNSADPPAVDLFDLRDALDALSEKEWRVVDLHYNRGWTFDQIAIELRMPRGSVSGVLRSALRTLKAAIADRETPRRKKRRAD